MARVSAKQFSKSLKDLTKVPSQIARKVANRIRRDIALNFSAGTDPYKKAWKPLAPATLAKGRHPPPLTDTWKGRRGIKVKPTSGAGIRLSSSVPYMVHHQMGTSHVPRRAFFPIGTLPKRWREIWQDELTKATRAKLSRGK